MEPIKPYLKFATTAPYAWAIYMSIMLFSQTIAERVSSQAFNDSYIEGILYLLSGLAGVWFVVQVVINLKRLFRDKPSFNLNKAVKVTFLILVIGILNQLLQNINIDLSGNSSQTQQGILNNHVTIVPSTKCTRTEPYKNLPEFERALSLIQQRESEYLGKEDDQINNIFNCIFIQYAGAREKYNAEGYFIFDSTSANGNYLPIYVDSSYKITDDLLTATLIYHELQHARQFVRSLNNVDKNDCYGKEIQAFFMQASFVAFMLNEEESKSLFARMDNYDIHNQLKLLDLLTNYIVEAGEICQNKAQTEEGTRCFIGNILKKIDAMVKASPYYQRQCANNS